MLTKLKNKIIVSCQSEEGEPLFGSDIMTRMAISSVNGGASGIRAQGVSDINAIKKAINLPIIGLIKKKYPDSSVYITPTKTEVDSLVSTKCEIIALDATLRPRPNGEKLSDLVDLVHAKSILAMGDCSTIEDAIEAEKIGFDIVSTTLSGYTEYSSERTTPDFDLLEEMVSKLNIPVFAEGHIWTVDDISRITKIGVYSIVIGSAITRPAIITKRFVDALSSSD